MADFRTPLRDTRFLLYDVFDFEVALCAAVRSRDA